MGGYGKPVCVLSEAGRRQIRGRAGVRGLLLHSGSGTVRRFSYYGSRLQPADEAYRYQYLRGKPRAGQFRGVQGCHKPLGVYSYRCACRFRQHILDRDSFQRPAALSSGRRHDRACRRLALLRCVGYRKRRGRAAMDKHASRHGAPQSRIDGCR